MKFTLIIMLLSSHPGTSSTTTTVEFNSERLCEQAATVTRAQLGPNDGTLYERIRIKAYCVQSAAPETLAELESALQ